MPGDDAGLAVPGVVPGELQDLGGEVLNVVGGTGAHLLSVVAFPVNEELDFFPDKNLIPSPT